MEGTKYRSHWQRSHVKSPKGPKAADPNHPCKCKAGLLRLWNLFRKSSQGWRNTQQRPTCTNHTTTWPTPHLHAQPPCGSHPNIQALKQAVGSESLGNMVGLREVILYCKWLVEKGLPYEALPFCPSPLKGKASFKKISPKNIPNSQDASK